MLEGKRVVLIQIDDHYNDKLGRSGSNLYIGPGSMGTVLFVDAIGTVHVNWDNGSRLGLVPHVDKWEVMEDETEKAT